MVFGTYENWSPKWREQLWDIPSVSLPFGSLLSSLFPNLTPIPLEPLLSSDTQYRRVVHYGLSLFFQETSGSYGPVQETPCLCQAQVEMSSGMTKSSRVGNASRASKARGHTASVAIYESTQWLQTIHSTDFHVVYYTNIKFSQRLT